MKQLTNQDIDALERWWVEKSRVNFLAYRQYINAGNFKCNWFVEDLCKNLQNFFCEMVKGKRPDYIFSTPPQHGKSIAISDFLAWAIGRYSRISTGLRSIYASFSDHLGVRCNLQLQRQFFSKKFKNIFPQFEAPKAQKITANNLFQRNRNIIEFKAPYGYFRNTTVGGPVTGETLDLGIIDDALKGREQANSQLYRDKIWEWLTDDFFTRFSEYAGLLGIGTRWNLDDWIGRIKEKYPTAKFFNYKAIADKDEENRKAGEPLFPELKSLEFLEKRKELMSEENWLSLYQGQPIIKGGNLFKLDQFVWWVNQPKIRYKYGDLLLLRAH